jgi:hypothetical protein
VTDAALILKLSKEIRADAERPTVDQQINPTDPVAIEIVLHEADFAVDKYMAKWTQWREKFTDPTVYDNFVWEYKLLVRREIKQLIASAQQIIAAELEEEDEEGDPDGGV